MRDEAVLHIFLLAQRRQCHNNFEGFDIGSHDDHFDGALGHLLEDLIDALLDLLEGSQLLDEFTYFFGEFGVGHWFWL